MNRIATRILWPIALSLRGAANIQYGGTLALTNLGGTLTAGDSFKLFYAASYGGAFTNLIPPMPGSGLAWDTSSLATNGTLSITVAPKPVIAGFTVDGGNLVLIGTNGIPNAPCYLLTSSNLSLRVSEWSTVSTNCFTADSLLFITNDLTHDILQQFYMLHLL